jgi:hypothetical protein
MYVCVTLNDHLRSVSFTQSLDIAMYVDYDGGFTLGVDVALPFNREAFVSVTLRRLTGRARLQFTRLPYTHWSFSFLQVWHFFLQTPTYVGCIVFSLSRL